MLEVELEDPITIPNQQTTPIIIKSPMIRKMSDVLNKEKRRGGYHLRLDCANVSMLPPAIMKLMLIPMAMTTSSAVWFLKNSLITLFYHLPEHKRKYYGTSVFFSGNRRVL
jgi:hypothetical protein